MFLSLKDSHRRQRFESDENVINDWFEQLDKSFVVDGYKAPEHLWENVPYNIASIDYTKKNKSDM